MSTDHWNCLYSTCSPANSSHPLWDLNLIFSENTALPCTHDATSKIFPFHLLYSTSIYEGGVVTPILLGTPFNLSRFFLRSSRSAKTSVVDVSISYDQASRLDTFIISTHIVRTSFCRYTILTLYRLILLTYSFAFWIYPLRLAVLEIFQVLRLPIFYLDFW